MNNKQLKDLKVILRSLELNQELFTHIQLAVESEKSVLDCRLDNYENKRYGSFSNKTWDLEDRIDRLDEETDYLDEISTVFDNLVGIMREKLGFIEGGSMPGAPMISVPVDKPQSSTTLNPNRDPLFIDIARLVVSSETASTAALQRRYNIGYNRACKVMDELEEAGIVGAAHGGKPRSVLIDSETLETMLANGSI